MPSQFDVAVVGAGAAGLAAALALSKHPLSVLLVDARDRVGGRAHTALSTTGLPIDLGCGWLHSADENPLVPLIEAAGFSIDRTPPAWQRQSDDLGFAASEQAAFARAFDDFEGRLATTARLGRDGPASAYFRPGERWNPLMDAVSSYYNGVEYDRVSVLDYDAYRDSGVNWRVRDGYGTALAALARPIEITLDCPVSQIAYEGTGLRLSTPKGEIAARRVIVTVPTPHLASGRLALPAGADEAVEAAAGLPLGLANKVFLGLDAAEALPADGHLFGRTDRVATGSYHLRPFGRPYVEAFLGGRHAADLEAAGTGAATAFAVEELTRLLGSDLGRRLRPLGETAWGLDPFALGSYSHAEPGAAAARARLARSTDDRIFIAGEATHPTAFSTAHGAWQTGLRAAQEVLGSIDAGR